MQQRNRVCSPQECTHKGLGHDSKPIHILHSSSFIYENNAPCNESKEAFLNTTLHRFHLGKASAKRGIFCSFNLYSRKF